MSIRTNSSYPKEFGRVLKKAKEGKNKPKQNRRPLKNVLQGQLSMECILVFRLSTHAEHQKLGLSLSPILTSSGYCGVTEAVMNSNTFYHCGTHKQQHKLIKQKRVSFLLDFHFLNDNLKHLSQLSNVQLIFFIHFYHLPCGTFFAF